MLCPSNCRSWANCCQHFSHQKASGHQRKMWATRHKMGKDCRLGEEDGFFQVSSRNDTGIFSGMLGITPELQDASSVALSYPVIFTVGVGILGTSHYKMRKLRPKDMQRSRSECCGGSYSWHFELSLMLWCHGVGNWVLQAPILPVSIYE